MALQGNWQAAGTLFLSAEPNDLFDVKKITTKNFKPVINTISTGATVDLKQPLSVNTVDPDGTPLDAKSFTAGQCKITKISKGFGTLQDCFIDGNGVAVYRFLVNAPKTTDSNLCPGVQFSATKGTGEAMAGSGLGQNTFLFQIK